MFRTFLRNWVVPMGYLQLYRRSVRRNDERIVFDQGLFDQNKKFKSIHQGQRCFILASGPSIRTQDLSPIYGEICIAVSHFHLHEKIADIKPRYHVLAPQHPPFNFSDSSKYFNDFLTNYATIDPTIFLGLTDYEFNYLRLLESYPKYQTIPNLRFLNYSSPPQLEEDNYMNDELWDVSGAPFSIRTVLYSAIQLAVYMGFKEIFLLGADHDYLNDINRTTNHHFYAEEKGISDKNHLEGFDRERWFFEYYMRWKHYRLMREYCERKGISIYNATQGGMLDVFPRKSLTSLILQ